MKMKVVLLLRQLSLVSLVWSCALAQQLVDVPGCACPATDCAAAEANSNLLDGALEACTFAFSGTAPFANITDQSTPLCDTLENSAEFQSQVGADADTIYFFSDSSVSRGPYYKTLLLPLWMGNGTCESAMEEQSSCVDENGSGSDSAFSKTTSRLEPGSCLQISTTLPVGENNNNSTSELPIKISASCQSSFDESITTGFDDSLVIYVETGDNTGVDLCDKEGVAGLTPALTSTEWVMTGEQRRYMCYEFTTASSPESSFYILTMSLGNAPCSGPEEVPPTTPSAAASVVGMYIFLTTGIAIGSCFLLY